MREYYVKDCFTFFAAGILSAAKALSLLCYRFLADLSRGSTGNVSMVWKQMCFINSRASRSRGAIEQFSGVDVHTLYFSARYAAREGSSCTPRLLERLIETGGYHLH